MTVIIGAGALSMKEGPQVLVNLVNCHGKLVSANPQFALKFPGNEKAYRYQCTRAMFGPGEVFVYELDAAEQSVMPGVMWIVNIGVRDHWRSEVHGEWLRAGFAALRSWAHGKGIRVIGCLAETLANGHVDRQTVEHVAREVFDVDAVSMAVYATSGAEVPARPARKGFANLEKKIK